MEGLEWFWLNSLAIILALSFINKYKEKKKDIQNGTFSSISAATSTTGVDQEDGAADVDAADIDAADNDNTTTSTAVATSTTDVAKGDGASDVVSADNDDTTASADVANYTNAVAKNNGGAADAGFANNDDTTTSADVVTSTTAVVKEDGAADVASADNGVATISAAVQPWDSDGDCTKLVRIDESIEVEEQQERFTQGIKQKVQKEVSAVEKSEIIYLNLRDNQPHEMITSTCELVTIECLREMFTDSTKEVWAFMEMKNQIYSAQIIMTQGSLHLKSLSKTAPPMNTERIPYQDVKNLINTNNITTFLEISNDQRNNLDGRSIFIHIQLKGDEGRTKQFELMCTGEEDGISYAGTTFLEIESSPLSAIWGGARNDGHCGAIGGLTTGGEIIKTVTPGLVAGSFQRQPTYFVIYTKGNEDYKENCTIGKVVSGLNYIHSIYAQADLHGLKSINIDDCGIVLAGSQFKSKPSPITIEYLKEMVNQSTSGVWAVLNMKGRDYWAQIVDIKGYLLLKSLCNRAPVSNVTTIPYQEVKDLVNRDNITIFLEIKLSEKEDSNSRHRFIHIKLFGSQGRHQQFEAMCTGEVNGISYAKTAFIDIIESPIQGLWGGARNDGLDTQLSGYTRGESGRTYITPGLVAGFYDSTRGRKPTHFIIYPEEASHSYQEESSIGKVVLGLNDIHILYTYAKRNGAANIEIDDCGIVLD